MKIGTISVLCCLLLLSSLLFAEVIAPGNAGSLGTINYIGGNLALATTVNARGGSTISSIDGISPTYCWGATAAGGNDGAGQNLIWSASYSWHIDALNKAPTAPYFFQVNFGNLSGVPNQTNQEYAVSQIRVYGRADTQWGDQFQGTVSVLGLDGSTRSTSQVVGNSSVQPLVAFNYGGVGVIGRTLDYRNMISFNEIEAYGMQNFTLASSDTLQIEVGSAGNDYVNVQGNAVLNGQIQMSLLNGFLPNTQPITILSAASINTANLTLTGSFQFSVVSGGNGQLLQVSYVPEPSSWICLLVCLAFFYHAKRNRS